jgi:hypothetical protein
MFSPARSGHRAAIFYRGPRQTAAWGLGTVGTSAIFLAVILGLMSYLR